MKKLFILPLFCLLIGVFICCDNESKSQAPFMEISVYDGSHNEYPMMRIHLPNDTVWVADSTITETGTIYFDRVDTIYRVDVDSFCIPADIDTLLFRLNTNSTWQMEISQAAWDTVIINGVVSPAPINWFTRPKVMSGGGNGSVSIPVQKNMLTHQRGVIFIFASKNPNVRCGFMFTQAGQPNK